MCTNAELPCRCLERVAVANIVRSLKLHKVLCARQLRKSGNRGGGNVIELAGRGSHLCGAGMEGYWDEGSSAAAAAA
jgi:hypothetical protein